MPYDLDSKLEKNVGVERMGMKRKAPNASLVHLFVLFFIKSHI